MKNIFIRKDFIKKYKGKVIICIKWFLINVNYERLVVSEYKLVRKNLK